MFNFKDSDTYQQMFSGSEAAANYSEVKGYSSSSQTDPDIFTEPTSPQKSTKKAKTKAKSDTIKGYLYGYAAWTNLVRQLIGFALLLSILPYSLLFEIRFLWWNYSAIPSAIRRPNWEAVENSIIGGLVKFAEQGGARRPGQDLYTTPDLLRLLIHWVLILALILFVFGFCNQVEVTPSSLKIRYAGFWRKIRWENISFIRTIELTAPTERLVVLVQTKGRGLSFFHRLYSLLLGAGWQKGFIITSDIKHFDNLVQYLIYYKTQKMTLTPEQQATVSNPAELFVEDGFVSPALQGTLEPSALMDTVINEFPPNETSVPRWPDKETRAELFPKMAAIALVVPVLYLIGNLLRLEQVTPLILVGAALLWLLGMFEWVFVSYFIYLNGLQFALLNRFRPALLGYPYLQGSRIIAGLLAVTMVILLAPGWLVFLVIATACVWGAVLTMLFTARLFEFDFNRAVLAGLGTLAYQLVFLAIYNLVK